MSQDTVRRAVELFSQRHNCAQSVLAACADNYGLSCDTAMKLTSGLGGGIARTGETCGAVLGASLVLGLDCGSVADPYKSMGRLLAIERVGEFLESFKMRCGATPCRELIGYDISTEAGRAEANQSGVFNRLCPGFVQTAAELLDSLLVNGKTGSEN